MMLDDYEKDEYGFSGWVFAVVGITIGLLWIIVLMLAPAALIKLCWTFLTA